VVLAAVRWSYEISHFAVPPASVHSISSDFCSTNISSIQSSTKWLQLLESRLLLPSATSNRFACSKFWHKMLYSCTHMASVGIKGLTYNVVLTFSGEASFCVISSLSFVLSGKKRPPKENAVKCTVYNIIQ